LVLSVPEIRETKINYLTDEFILLGCDGLYDVFTSMECITFVRDKLAQMPIGEQDPQAVAGELVRTAIKNSTQSHKHSDNVSVIIVCLTRGINIADQNNQNMMNNYYHIQQMQQIHNQQQLQQQNMNNILNNNINLMTTTINPSEKKFAKLR